MKQTEYDLQCECVKHLEKLKNSKKIDFFTAIPNSTFTKSWAVKRKNTLSGVRSGLCDLFIVINGIPFFIELKTLTGTLQPSQKEVIKILNKTFNLAYIACSFDEFCILIDDCIIASTNDIKFKDTEYAEADGKGAKMLKKLMKYE